MDNDVTEVAAAEPAVQEAPETQGSSEPQENSLRSSLQKAFDQIDSGATQKATKEPEPEAEDLEDSEEEGDEQPDQEDDAYLSAPSRFSADAKQAWKDAPLPVRAEIDRAVKELEAGINQYKADFEPYKEFDKQLKATGQDFREVVAHYTGIENLLRQDPLKGLDQICQNLGVSLRDVAAHVMGQTPDQSASQQDAYIRELKSEIADLKKQVGGVTQSITAERQAQIDKQIMEFSAQNPRFDELQNDMALLIQAGRANDLQEAYDLAARLNPAPDQAPVIASQEATNADKKAAQTRKGQLSLSGSPRNGSNPAAKITSKTPREALEKAFSQTGL